MNTAPADLWQGIGPDGAGAEPSGLLPHAGRGRHGERRGRSAAVRAVCPGLCAQLVMCTSLTVALRQSPPEPRHPLRQHQRRLHDSLLPLVRRRGCTGPAGAGRAWLAAERRGRGFLGRLPDEALKDGPYGRYVYACDNDVVDHQVVALEFPGATTATFTMTAFSKAAGRSTRLFGAGLMDAFTGAMPSRLSSGRQHARSQSA